MSLNLVHCKCKIFYIINIYKNNTQLRKTRVIKFFINNKIILTIFNDTVIDEVDGSIKFIYTYTNNRLNLNSYTIDNFVFVIYY